MKLGANDIFMSWVGLIVGTSGIMLGVRLKEGIDLDLAADDLGVEVSTVARRRAVDELVASGRVEREGGVIRVSGSARLYTDGIAIALF